jgi:hypothetical protein
MSKIIYQSAMGNFMYFMICTRPDIVYAHEVVRRFMINLSEAY